MFRQLQRGGTLLGFILGLLIGLGVAVAVALYITNAPIPFVNKVKPATENINPGAGGKLPDPNRALISPSPNAGAPAEAPATAVVPTEVPKEMAPADAKTQAALEEGSRFLLQAGAFKTPEDADAMRARLALMGLDAKVFPREEGGTTLYRVRLGPYGSLDEINRVRKSLADNGVDSQLVRIK